MENASDPAAGDRRRFLQLLALVGLSSAVAGAAWSGQGPAPTAAPGAASPPAPDTTGAGKPREISADARDLAGIVRRRYGRHLDEQQLGEVTDEIDGRLESGRRLRAVKLGNHEEPDFTFRA